MGDYKRPQSQKLRFTNSEAWLYRLCLLKKQIIHCEKSERLSHLDGKFHPAHGHTDALAMVNTTYSFSGTTAWFTPQ